MRIFLLLVVLTQFFPVHVFALTQCKSSKDCKDNMLCEQGKCRLKIGTACTAHYQCIQGSYCAPNTKNQKYFCIRKKILGTCSEGLECVSGICLSGKCVGSNTSSATSRPLPPLNAGSASKSTRSFSSGWTVKTEKGKTIMRSIYLFSIGFETAYIQRLRYLSKYSIMFGGLRFGMYLGFMKASLFWHGGTSFASKKGFHMDAGGDIEFQFFHPYSGLFKLPFFVGSFGFGYRAWLVDVRHDRSPYFEQHSMDGFVRCGAFVSKRFVVSATFKDALVYWYRFPRKSKRFTMRPLQQLQVLLNVSYIF